MGPKSISKRNSVISLRSDPTRPILDLSVPEARILLLDLDTLKEERFPSTETDRTRKFPTKISETRLVGLPNFLMSVKLIHPERVNNKYKALGKDYEFLLRWEQSPSSGLCPRTQIVLIRHLGSVE